MARAATCYDAPPILEPTREMVEAVRAYYSARLAADDDKSGFSDSFKRAAVKFGVARYLYRDGVPAFVEERTPVATAPSEPSPATNGTSKQYDKWAASKPASAPKPKPEPPRTNHEGGAPRTGRAFFAWVKDTEKRLDISMLRYLNEWGKDRDYPGRMVDWTAEQVAQAFAEAQRMLANHESQEAA